MAALTVWPGACQWLKKPRICLTPVTRRSQWGDALYWDCTRHYWSALHEEAKDDADEIVLLWRR